MKNLYFLLLFLTLVLVGPLWAQDKDDINKAVDKRIKELIEEGVIKGP